MATIPHVVPDTLIESAAQNAFIDEVNNVCAKRTGSSMSGTLTFTNSLPAFKLRATGEQPYFQFESVAGTRLAYIREQAGVGMFYAVDAADEYHRWVVNGVPIATLDNTGLLLHRTGMGLTVPGGANFGGGIGANSGTFSRDDDINQILVVDTAGSGGTVGDGHAFISFYPSGTASAVGARGAYVGFNGEGMQVQADSGPITVQSVTADIHMLGTGVLVGKTAADTADVGVELFGPTAGTATLRGAVRSTTNAASASNVTLRHMGAASADGQKFISFVNNAGTEVGSITQQGSGIRINNDLLLAQVEALEARITELEARLS